MEEKLAIKRYSEGKTSYAEYMFEFWSAHSKIGLAGIIIMMILFILLGLQLTIWK